MEARRSDCRRRAPHLDRHLRAGARSGCRREHPSLHPLHRFHCAAHTYRAAVPQRRAGACRVVRVSPSASSTRGGCPCRPFTIRHSQRPIPTHLPERFASVRPFRMRRSWPRMDVAVGYWSTWPPTDVRRCAGASHLRCPTPSPWHRQLGLSRRYSWWSVTT